MKTGFELLETQNDDFDSILNAMESKYNIYLPPIYRLFALQFKLGRFKYEMYLDSNSNTLDYCSAIYYQPKGIGPDNIGIVGMDPIDLVFENRRDLHGYGDGDIESNLLRVASIGMGGGIFVGMDPDNLDSIILRLWEETPGHEKLANNIFDFIRNVVSVKIDDKENNAFQYSHLYKMWNDDFWRVDQVK